MYIESSAIPTIVFHQQYHERLTSSVRVLKYSTVLHMFQGSLRVHLAWLAIQKLATNNFSI